MNASLRESDQGPSKDEPLKYAPKKARPPDPEQTSGAPKPAGDAASTGDTAPPSPAPEPPWRRSRHRGAFVGDVAIAELRTKLALAPDRLPEPPPSGLRGSKVIWMGRIAGVVVVAAVGFAGYRWGASPSAARFQLLHPASHSRLAPDRSAAANVSHGPTTGATAAAPTAAAYPPPAQPSPQPANGPPSRQLAVGTVGALQTDEVARLAISAADAGKATVVIGGLAPGSSLSAGKEVGPNRWQLSVDELPGVAITPPRSFAGVMDLTLELRLADNGVADRKALQVEWSRRSVPVWLQPRQHDAAEIAQMVKKGGELIANGDIAAARLMYQRAAEAGEAAAALSLAETYDPMAIARGGITPDVVLAHFWYEKAKDLGSTVAPERLQRLARQPE
jgi:hypothetical protein